MYFCLNFDTRKEHKTNTMKLNKINLCLSAYYALLFFISLGVVFFEHGVPCPLNFTTFISIFLFHVFHHYLWVDIELFFVSLPIYFVI